MKKLYTPLLILSLFIVVSGCSKDFLKRYEDRLEGTWALVNVDRVGFNSSTSGLPFRDGHFIFHDGGTMEYVSTANDTLHGSWDLRKRWMSGNCYTNDNGNYDCDDHYVRSMQINAINFVTQDVRAEFFDDIQFTSTNRFKAYIYSGYSTYVFRFLRK